MTVKAKKELGKHEATTALRSTADTMGRAGEG